MCFFFLLKYCKGFGCLDVWVMFYYSVLIFLFLFIYLFIFKVLVQNTLSELTRKRL